MTERFLKPNAKKIFSKLFLKKYLVMQNDLAVAVQRIFSYLAVFYTLK